MNFYNELFGHEFFPRDILSRDRSAMVTARRGASLSRGSTCQRTFADRLRSR